MQLSEVRYGNILQKSFKTAWKNRFLWWFGFLIILGGSGTRMNPGLDERQSSEISTLTAPFLAQYGHILLIGAIIILLLFVGLVILSMIGRGGMIASLYALERGEQINFKIGFRKGMSTLWRILGVHVTMFLIVVAVAVTVVGPSIFFFINDNLVLGVILAVIGGLIFLPITIGVVLTTILADLYVVLGKLPVFSAIENGYLLLKKNIIVTIVMGLIVGAVRIVTSLIFLLTIVAIGVPIFLLGVLFGAIWEEHAIIIAVVSAIAILIPIFMIIASALETLIQSIWFQFFHQIARKKQPTTPQTEVTALKSPTKSLNPVTNSEY